MKTRTMRLAAAMLLLAGGCSTKNLEPEITAFGSSVDVALKGAEREITQMKLNDRLRQDQITSLVEANGFFQLGCDGTYVDSLEIDVDDPRQIPLAEKCPLERFDANSKSFEYKPSNRVLSEAVQARRLVVPLRSYAAALEDLSNSKAPEEVSRKFATASKALRDLAVDASKLGGGSGIPANTQKILETGSGLVAILAREGLEAMRYSAVKSIVTNGDPAVHGAGMILATWMQSREADGLSEGMEGVRVAEEAAIESKFAGDPADMQVKYEAVVSAYEAAIKADDEAKWRVFISMVIAHGALKDAFDRPADFATLQEAQKRLDDFVVQALKLKAALDAGG